MEKYTKFDDPSNGLNPFTPLETTAKLTGYKSVLRKMLAIFFIILRTPLFLICWNVGVILHTTKYLLLVPQLVRFAETFIDHLIGQLIMSISSFNGLKVTYHREHKDYDFIKLQKGELKVTIEPGDLYVCNQTCFADWVYLYMTLSPVFTQIVIVKPTNGPTKVGLRKLGAFETVLAAFGIKFPEEVTEENGVYFSVK